MRVAFDNQAFTMQAYGGVSRYFSGLAESLTTQEAVYPRVFTPLHVNTHLMEKRNIRAGLRIKKIPRAGRFLRRVNHILSAVPIRLFKPDVVHETYFSSRAFGLNAVPRVTTVHDMIHEKYADFFPARDPNSRWKRASVDRADLVICVSHNTQKDLIDIFNVPEEKTRVVHLGFDMPAFKGNDQVIKAPVDYPYILFVGARTGYKNFSCLLKAYASSSFLSKNVKIVCFGGGKITSMEQALMKNLGISPEDVIQFSGKDKLLYAFYRSARVFVYPSLYEGFGIPPLEAMAVGCPVVCSNVSSMPEVVGEAGAYADPRYPESFATALEKTLVDSHYREQLVGAGARRVLQYTWERCASGTLAGYRGLL